MKSVRNMHTARLARAAAMSGAVALSLTGCTSSAAPNSAASTKAIISHDWSAFFNGSGAAATKVMYLQNGTQFKAALDSLESSALAREATAKVDAVGDLTATTAKVTYTVSLGQEPVLSNQPGQAVKQGGVWKVSDATFCTLLAAEQVSSPGCAS